VRRRNTNQQKTIQEKNIFAMVSRSIPKRFNQQEEQSMRHKHFDDDNFDRNGLLKDGGRYRVHLTMMLPESHGCAF
jgi:hypothetical protein